MVLAPCSSVCLARYRRRSSNCKPAVYNFGFSSNCLADAAAAPEPCPTVDAVTTLMAVAAEHGATHGAIMALQHGDGVAGPRIPKPRRASSDAVTTRTPSLLNAALRTAPLLPLATSHTRAVASCHLGLSRK